MMKYNRFSPRDLFMNPALSGVFPQFKRGEKLQATYTDAEVEKRVAEYLANALNGTITGDGEITVQGNKRDVLNNVRRLQGIIEGFFNNMPKIFHALRRNTPIYLPCATLKQLERLNDTESKVKALQAVVDNLTYNSDFDSSDTGSARRENYEFTRRQREWETKVGYRRLKKI